MNGMHVYRATDFRPNLSINGPAMNDPMGKHIVTKLAIHVASDLFIWMELVVSFNCGNKIDE